MTDGNPADVRAQLESEGERLRNQLDQMGHDGDGALIFDEGFADVGQVTAERGEVSAIAGSLQEMLNEIEHAITKLDDGTFGVCESCSGLIQPARLEAQPSARRCIDCASQRR